MDNLVFGNGLNTIHNACVGNNGMPGIMHFARGYSTSANALIELYLSDDSGKYHQDEMIYPICFNMRHSIELRIKNELLLLQQLSSLKNQESSLENIMGHDINEIWETFKTKSASIDKRYYELITLLDQYIKDIGKIDAKGQTFRYPESNNKIRHLTEVRIINIERLNHVFTYIEERMEELNMLSENLIEEYSKGSFTQKLSRQDIMHISECLLSRDQWKEDVFTLQKEKLRAEYSLSNREFIQCINIIREHYEFSLNINMDLDLLGVTEESLDAYYSSWQEINMDYGNTPKQSKEMIKIYMPSLDDLIKYDKLKTKAWSDNQHLVTVEYVSGLRALYDFGYNLKYSEDYIRKYKSNVKELNARQKTEKGVLKEEFLDILTKINGLHNIRKSINFLKPY
ncbi:MULTISPECIES: hypothetical protein [Cobetia]|uniref:hypothetical protein n=1 Tax=Cobetia TaxID=204286 RepID=UPI000A715B2B|nr:MULTISPECIES: hypothetical protein [Cobetia]MBR9756400.1 hypothetical protein [Gammaproteobacteria bacterium]MBR9798815.1 hypothetical protein [Gammaproteobacteria bacterium]QWN37168.1 hypothetical protein H2O77_01085 [Cobetia sp. 4B]UBU48933.1 hypothetical protein LCW13_01190 [Cobetia amphilecti]BBO54924.1 hypothetical protein CLAM6_02350 [Cobetia sp. AM6]